VTYKSSQRDVVEFLQREAAPVDPISEVLRRSNVSASDLHDVTGLRQGLRKPFKQRTSWSISQRVNAPPADVQF